MSRKHKRIEKHHEITDDTLSDVETPRSPTLLSGCSISEVLLSPTPLTNSETEEHVSIAMVKSMTFVLHLHCILAS